MAEIDTSVYRTQPQDPLKQPLAIMQLLGAVNQNKLFQQTYDSREKVGQAYQQSIGPDGKIDNIKLRSLIKDAGFGAGEAISQANTNETGQFNLDAARLQKAQQLYAPLAANKNVTLGDVNNFSVRAAKLAGIPSETITAMNDGAREAFKTGGSKGLQKYLATTGMLSLGIGSLEGTEGTPVSGGQIPKIPQGQAILERLQPGGMVTTNRPGFETAATGIAAQSAASANSLSQANDSSMTRKGMLGNLDEDLTKFTSGPSADWTKFAKAWINRNVPKPKGWEFDPSSIASQEQFNKQSAMLAQQQFEAIGGTGTDAKFNSAFTTSPNEVLSELGNKGIIRLLKGNEDAIQAKNKAWVDWRRQGNGPDTYPDFSAQFNESFDPRAFQFKYIPEKERQKYVDRMDDDERMQFLRNLTSARKHGWINYQPPKSE